MFVFSAWKYSASYTATGYGRNTIIPTTILSGAVAALTTADAACIFLLGSPNWDINKKLHIVIIVGE
mgnify:FL=1